VPEDLLNFTVGVRMLEFVSLLIICCNTLYGLGSTSCFT